MCECCSNHAKLHESHLHVTGVNCGYCVGTIEKALADFPGINGIEHNAEARQMKVLFDSRIVDVERLKGIIAELGYSVA